MRLPSISPDNKSRDYIDVFGGYNHNPRINENEFYDMKNMSSDSYPLLSVRPQRGKIPTAAIGVSNLPKGGFIYRSGLFFIMIGALNNGTYPITLEGPREYAGQTQLMDIATWRSEYSGARKIVPMGSKLIILPDKLVVNLADLGHATDNAMPMENEKTTVGTVKIQPCLEDGTVLSIDYVGDTAPETPPDGYVWLDTRYSPESLKKYYASSGTWQTYYSSYAKIDNTNNARYDIAKGFAEGDGITISGVKPPLKSLNKSTTIKTIADNGKSIVVNATIEPIDSILTAQETQKAGADDEYTSFYFLCTTKVKANHFANKYIKIGSNEPWLCTANSAADAENAYEWEVDHITGRFNAGGTMEEVVTIKSSTSAQSGSTIYLANEWIDEEGDAYTFDTETIAAIASVASSTDGLYLMFGLNGVIAKCTNAEIVVENSTTKYKLTLNKAVDVPANTVIYGVKKVFNDGMYRIGLQFRNIGGESVTIGEKGYHTPETQFSQSTPITLSRRMPEMDFVIESQNRLWGCKYGKTSDGKILNEIYCSKLGDEKNWTVYEGISTDSYTASVGTEGEWTGAVNYRGYPVFFKEHYIHTVLGSYPPYQINSTEARGIQKGSSDSLAMINEILYYKSIHGICAYSGGLPADVSSALGNVHYKDAIACAFKDKYYICMKDDAGHPSMFVYDTGKGLWHKEDDLYVDQFAVADDDVYYIKTVDGTVTTGSLFGTGGKDNAPIDWYAETGIFGLSMIDRKYICRLNLRLMLPIESNMYISIMYDSSGQWETIGYVRGHGLSPFTLPIKPKRCDHFKIRLFGKGDMKLYGISKTIEQGSDR